jgi:hypothetical protein
VITEFHAGVSTSLDATRVLVEERLEAFDAGFFAAKGREHCLCFAIESIDM